jgi:F-type H+-transporting ATPase subunit b
MEEEAHEEDAALAATGEHAEAADHASGGLPQFDASTWPGQIAWFLIIFFVVFLIMRMIIVPRIGGAIDGRSAKIESDIADARRMKDDADAAAEATAADLAQARANAQKVAGEARDKAKAQVAEKLSEEEAKLAETTAAAEAKIATARDAAMAHVSEIGADAAKAIVAQLTGSGATAAELKAAAKA